MVEYHFDPRDVAMQVERSPAGTMQIGHASEFRDVIRALYKRFSTPRNMLAHRAPVTWDSLMRDTGSAPTWAAVHFDAGGNLTATGCSGLETTTDRTPDRTRS
ncbi:MAG: hypothetical protein CMQ24_07705 [Gammaproteobacteria bacterium]|nr:hypothetical protein [Gammaproteobacteria bacterium]